MSRAGAGALAALAGGFLAAAGGAATWLERDATRVVGGVPVADVETLAGTAFAPLLLPLGVFVIVLAGAGLVSRGAVRRAVTGASAVAGVALAWLAAEGLLRASGLEGEITASPWTALAGGLLTAVGALAGLRPAAAEPPLLDERYTVEGAPAEDAEWELAAEEPPETAP